MNEWDIGEIIVDEEISIGDIELDVVKLLPELEDLVVTPSGEEQNFKSTKYGYNNVKVKAADLREDLTTELTEQANLLKTQEIIIKQIIEALEEKIQENTSTTIEEIEQLIVSYFENKTVEEVEA